MSPWVISIYTIPTFTLTLRNAKNYSYPMPNLSHTWSIESSKSLITVVQSLPKTPAHPRSVIIATSIYHQASEESRCSSIVAIIHLILCIFATHYIMHKYVKTFHSLSPLWDPTNNYAGTDFRNAVYELFIRGPQWYKY